MIVRTRTSSAERRIQILRTAAELLLEKGFSFTTKEVGARIGITETLVFHHFSTKKDLIHAVYENHFSSIQPERSIPESPTPGRVRLDLARYCVGLYRGVARDRTLEMLYLYALSKSDHRPDRDSVNDIGPRLRGPLVGYFRNGIKSGVFRKSLKPESMAEVLHNVMFHFLFFTKILEKRELTDSELREQTGRFLELFLNGARKRTPA